MQGIQGKRKRHTSQDILEEKTKSSKLPLELSYCSPVLNTAGILTTVVQYLGYLEIYVR